MNTSKARVWTFILYPDSLPENWKDIIQQGEFIVPTVISPLHDKDVNEDGSEKKPHYHAMVMFNCVKSFTQVRKLYLPLSGHTEEHKFKVDQVHSTNAMIRYFCHADQKAKAQYLKSDILSLNGADVDNLFITNDKEIYQIVGKMLECIYDNEIKEFADFVDHVRENEPDWFPLLCGQYSNFIQSYIKSRRWRGEKVWPQQNSS